MPIPFRFHFPTANERMELKSALAKNAKEPYFSGIYGNLLIVQVLAAHPLRNAVDLLLELSKVPAVFGSMLGFVFRL